MGDRLVVARDSRSLGDRVIRESFRTPLFL